MLRREAGAQRSTRPQPTLVILPGQLAVPHSYFHFAVSRPSEHTARLGRAAIDTSTTVSIVHPYAYYLLVSDVEYVSVFSVFTPPK